MDSRKVDKMATVKEKPSSSKHGDPDRRWRAVLARDRQSDGSFVYAVRSTGVYCRPSCSSRRPNREQVVFFPGPEAAEKAGFRHCRRCRPDQNFPAGRPLEIVNLVCRYIQNHWQNSQQNN
jgi:AraC family transcriptional regulator of adaptative response/methylated-DNA-[protein]-cysteine methyltransferase